MFTVGLTCDGPEYVDVASCRVAFTHGGATDVEEAAAAAADLDDLALSSGWRKHRHDGHEVFFCPSCWPHYSEEQNAIRARCGMDPI
ncbi:hypothetical protein [Streptacidiphilus cavernicola]|uniref:Uncharacterized protein n=1 Tax=Streptacidiphilus cavernicola TaxID=3342716 RepID=A0ABV6VYG0_9ACTN